MQYVFSTLVPQITEFWDDTKQLYCIPRIYTMNSPAITVLHLVVIAREITKCYKWLRSCCLGSLPAPPLSRFSRGSGISIYFSMVDLWVGNAAAAEGILGVCLLTFYL